MCPLPGPPLHPTSTLSRSLSRNMPVPRARSHTHDRTIALRGAPPLWMGPRVESRRRKTKKSLFLINLPDNVFHLIISEKHTDGAHVVVIWSECRARPHDLTDPKSSHEREISSRSRLHLVSSEHGKSIHFSPSSLRFTSSFKRVPARRPRLSHACCSAEGSSYPSFSSSSAATH